MKKSPILLLVLGIVLAAGLIGCGGGGGGGGRAIGVAPDAGPITQTLNSFASALHAKNSAGASKLLSKRLSAAVAGGASTLTIFDFGNDINNSGDDNSYVFVIPAGGIVQASTEYAEVTAEFQTSTGVLITLKFVVIKEQGVWVIDSIESTSQGQQSFNLANQVLLGSGNSWTYDIYYNGGTKSQYQIRYTVATNTVSVTTPAGTRTGYAQFSEVLDSTGNVVARSGSPLSGNFVYNPKARFPWDSSTFATGTYATGQGLQYFGNTGSEASFNSGTPWTMVPQIAKVGDVATQTFDVSVGGATLNYHATTNVKGLTTVSGLSVMPVELGLLDTGDNIGSTGTIYLNPQFGIVKFEIQALGYSEILARATIGGSVITPTGGTTTPPVAAVATPTMTLKVERIDATTLECTFANSGGTILDLDQGTVAAPRTALTLGNYSLLEKNVTKAGATLATSSFTPVSAVANGSDRVRLSFTGVADLDNPNLMLKADGVFNDTLGYWVASVPTVIASHTLLTGFTSWSSLGYPAAWPTPLDIKLIRTGNPSDGEKLLVVSASGTVALNVSKTMAGDIRKLAFSADSPLDWTTSAYGSNRDFFDVTVTKSSTGAITDIWGFSLTLPGGTTPQLGQQLFNSGLSHPLVAAPTPVVSLTEPVQVCGFNFTNGNTFLVVADDPGVGAGKDIACFQWSGGAPVLVDRAFSFSGAGTNDIQAGDSWQDDTVGQLKFLAGNALHTFSLNNTTGALTHNAPILGVTGFVSYSTSFPVGLAWMKNAGADAVTTHGHAVTGSDNLGANSELAYKIEGGQTLLTVKGANSANQGGLSLPFGVAIFGQAADPLVPEEVSFIVADQSGLSVFQKLY